MPEISSTTSFPPPDDLDSLAAKVDQAAAAVRGLPEDARQRAWALKAAGGLRAYRNQCPHQGLPLAGGSLDADENTLACPWQGFRFDCDTGECLTAPAVQVDRPTQPCRDRTESRPSGIRLGFLLAVWHRVGEGVAVGG